MIAPGYFRALALGLATWLGLFVAFTWTVDPYGVSPLRVELAGANILKPKRVNIDRIIKPYEVWWHQPRTIFLGTSRLHQSIDPSVLDGTRFAPAYNAALPNGSMELNIEYLKQYVQLDHNLRTVFVEVFLNNFLGEPEPRVPKTWTDFGKNAAVFFGSADALWDSVATLAHNAQKKSPTNEIKPGGYLYVPRGRSGMRRNFEGYETWLWSSVTHEPDRATLYRQVFDSIRDLIELAHVRNLELIFIVTPSYAFVEYYYDAIGAWDVIEECLTTLSGMGTVYSFSQPNPWTFEAPKDQMAYWIDPLHFSLGMGRGIQASLAGSPISGLPENFVERLTPDRVASHIESRRQGIRQWAQANTSFVSRFEQARRKWLMKETATKPN
jgi:hypothetical protein